MMKQITPTSVIYKICSRAIWESIRDQDQWAGSLDDQRDGFIHFSCEHQLAATVDKHFSGMPDLLALCINVQALGDQLKWEPSRGGELFPHLYGWLPLRAVTGVREL